MKIERLLVVEDEKVDLMIIERCFETENADLKIEGCMSSEHAVDRIVSADADIVLLDINMPGQNGMEVLKESRRRANGTFPPVIMLTSSENPNDVRAAYENGASAYVVKPSTIDGYRDLAKSVNAFWCNTAVRPA